MSKTDPQNEPWGGHVPKASSSTAGRDQIQTRKRDRKLAWFLFQKHIPVCPKRFYRAPLWRKSILITMQHFKSLIVLAFGANCDRVSESRPHCQLATTLPKLLKFV